MPGPYIHMSAARAAAGVEDGWAPTPSERVDPASPGPNLADLASMMIDRAGKIAPHPRVAEVRTAVQAFRLRPDEAALDFYKDLSLLAIAIKQKDAAAIRDYAKHPGIEPAANFREMLIGLDE